MYVTHDQGEAMVTSDRIAVMNAGRIEQVDPPYLLYTRPRTRFVAGFIGRTNLMQGTANGEHVAFDRFALPRGMFEDGGAALQGDLIFSVRPQSIGLHRAAPREGDARLVAGRLVERAFLGESWDYVVAPGESGMRLKVAAPPSQVFEVGEAVWLEFDPQQMAPIAP